MRVVRLKGGDPYVLGRGSEEAAACRAAGVDVEVVPGVTSALAVPAAAGIPVTARGVTSRFTVVSGHDGPARLRLPRRARRDVALPHGRQPTAGDRRRAGGERPLRRRAGRSHRARHHPEQRVTVATLATIAELAAARGVASPAVIVVGEVAAPADPADRVERDRCRTTC